MVLFLASRASSSVACPIGAAGLLEKNAMLRGNDPIGHTDPSGVGRRTCHGDATAIRIDGEIWTCRGMADEAHLGSSLTIVPPSPVDLVGGVAVAFPILVHRCGVGCRSSHCHHILHLRQLHVNGAQGVGIRPSGITFGRSGLRLFHEWTNWPHQENAGSNPSQLEVGGAALSRL